MKRLGLREKNAASSGFTCCWLLLLSLFLLKCSVCVLGYKPVIIIHGLFDTSADFINLKRFINQVKNPLFTCSDAAFDLFLILCRFYTLQLDRYSEPTV